MTPFLMIFSLTYLMCSGDQLQPKVMVVILVRNKAHLLENTLKLLEAQDYPKGQMLQMR